VRARKRARAFDRKGAKRAPLAGLPMTVKESFDVARLPTTRGLAEYCNTPVATNALAVERFLRAGANVFGKSNVPTLLADWETVNPVYGKTVNPWNHERTPGGSSGYALRRFPPSTEKADNSCATEPDKSKNPRH
jgi:amidase